MFKIETKNKIKDKCLSQCPAFYKIIIIIIIIIININETIGILVQKCRRHGLCTRYVGIQNKVSVLLIL